MTIREAEERSGLTRANIRFYEAQGLLAPARGANGYRDYSEEDVETLRRIRLLRALHVSVEEIRALRAGNGPLAPAMERQMAALAREREALGAARRVCGEIRDEAVRFVALDAQKYLDSLARPAAEETRTRAEDVLAEPRVPVRRFFARALDWQLCFTVWNVFLLLVCNVDPARGTPALSLFAWAVPLALTAAAEPVLLAVCGTTPGKWILGLSVADRDGGRLSLAEARRRTLGVLWHGLGLGVPVWRLMRLWKSCGACRAGERLDWEDESDLVLRGEGRWRAGVWAGACACLFGALVLAEGAAASPRFRGDITAAQFCENYNRFAAFYGIAQPGTLLPDGTWEEQHGDDVVTVVVDSLPAAPPRFAFTQQDGVLTGVSFTFEAAAARDWFPDRQAEMTLCALAFAGTQEGYGPFSAARRALLGAIEAHPGEAFSRKDAGIVCRCEAGAGPDAREIGRAHV